MDLQIVDKDPQVSDMGLEIADMDRRIVLGHCYRTTSLQAVADYFVHLVDCCCCCSLHSLAVRKIHSYDYECCQYS